jgi:hypothetical protein
MKMYLEWRDEGWEIEELDRFPSEMEFTSF